MAKRLSNESPIGDVLKAFIETNKLQTGMDKIDVQAAWKALMGNGVNSYTKEVFVCVADFGCVARRVELWQNQNHHDD